MEDKKLNEFLGELYDSFDESMKKKAEGCKNPDELLKLAGEAGIEIPDEFLDLAAGGVALKPEIKAKATTRLGDEGHYGRCAKCGAFKIVRTVGLLELCDSCSSTPNAKSSRSNFF